ncbi:hypothetical protein RZS08_45090, partial [Arthrospira platensis SPKY1]|nr:hypothetical protein [Arthrospira platensis SPKY1]
MEHMDKHGLVLLLIFILQNQNQVIMKQHYLSFLVIALLLLPGIGAAQWELLESNIIPTSYRTWSLKLAEDNSMWVLST